MIAAIGGKYGHPPKPGTPSAPNYSVMSNHTHGDFSAMMADGGGSVSGQALLGGHSVF